MQFCLASGKIFRTESILLSHVVMACFLAGSNYISVSFIVISEAIHVRDRHSLELYIIYGYNRIKTYLSICLFLLP